MSNGDPDIEAPIETLFPCTDQCGGWNLRIDGKDWPHRSYTDILDNIRVQQATVKRLIKGLNELKEVWFKEGGGNAIALCMAEIAEAALLGSPMSESTESLGIPGGRAAATSYEPVQPDIEALKVEIEELGYDGILALLKEDGQAPEAAWLAHEFIRAQQVTIAEKATEINRQEGFVTKVLRESHEVYELMSVTIADTVKDFIRDFFIEIACTCPIFHSKENVCIRCRYEELDPLL